MGRARLKKWLRFGSATADTPTARERERRVESLRNQTWRDIYSDHVDQRTFDEVDAYITGTVAPDDEVLVAVLARSAAAGLPDIQVSAPQGRLLQILVQLVGGGRVLEIGTLAGYSAILMARAGAQVITLEADAEHARVATENIAAAGLAEAVDVRVGPALEVLPELDGPFDLVFIDADKPNTPAYFEWAVERLRPGALIVADNVVRGGDLVSGDDPGAQAQRRLHEIVAEDPRLTATTMQTVGSKGYDGMLIARLD